MLSTVEVSQELEQKKKSKLEEVGGPSSGQSAVAGSRGKAAIPKSDAVLNCPACMATLCLDCQRLVTSNLSTP